MLKNKKILIILLLSLILSSLFINNSFAATVFPWTTYNSGIPQNVIDLVPSLNHYSEAKSICVFDYGIFRNVYAIIIILDENVPIDITGGTSSSKFINVHGRFYFYEIEKDSLNVELKGLSNMNYHDKCKDSNFFFTGSNCTVVENGEVFFQVAPYPGAVELMTPMKVEEIPGMMEKVLTILVPVGLIIFGILLLVYLIGSKRWLHL